MSGESVEKENLAVFRFSAKAEVRAPMPVVFDVLTSVPMLWWHVSALFLGSNDLEKRRLRFEPRVGGRLFELFPDQNEQGQGILLATITIFRPPDLLALEGSFGLSLAGLIHGTVTIGLQENDDDTNVEIAFQAYGVDQDGVSDVLKVIWTDFLHRVKTIAETVAAPIQPRSGVLGFSDEAVSEDPEMLLEQAYNELQMNLIQVRQAVAQAIATEKQLEQQLQRNEEQSRVWQQRAEMATQQNNPELADQARQRGVHYEDAAAELEAQYEEQRTATAKLRGSLTELEGEVQKAYTKKQVLIARSKAAQATKKAQESLLLVNTAGALALLDLVEKKVLDKEREAGIGIEENE